MSHQQNCDIDKNFILELEGLPWIFKQRSITLTFGFELFDLEAPDPVRCVIDVDERVKQDLLVFGWTAPPCWPVESELPSLSLLLKDLSP